MIFWTSHCNVCINIKQICESVNRSVKAIFLCQCIFNRSTAASWVFKNNLFSCLSDLGESTCELSMLREITHSFQSDIMLLFISGPAREQSTLRVTFVSVVYSASSLQRSHIHSGQLSHSALFIHLQAPTSSSCKKKSSGLQLSTYDNHDLHEWISSQIHFYIYFSVGISRNVLLWKTLPEFSCPHSGTSLPQAPSCARKPIITWA